MKANTTYAYTFSDKPGGGGYGNISNVGGNLYLYGALAQVPINGGTIGYSSSGLYDATFDLGLSLGSVTLGAQNIGGGQMKLSWPTGVLLQATNLLGPWTTNSAPSPYTVTPAGPQMFYRVKVQ